MSNISTSTSPRQARPPVVLRLKPVLRSEVQEQVALSSDPDWEEQFPVAKGQSIGAQNQKTQPTPSSSQDFLKLAECGHLLAKNLGWGPLQGIALRESGQIAAQRYGHRTKTDAHLAEEAFSLLLAAI